MRTRTIAEYVAAAILACTLVAVLAPALAIVSRPSAEAKCQSNMRRWAQAVALYTVDYGGRYPMNRYWSSPTAPEVPLSLDARGNVMLDANGNPVICRYGFNWVESLYPFLIKRARETGQDWQSFMKCPNALSSGLSSTTARMSYVMNFNLMQQNHALIRNPEPEKVMMLREMDRLVNSACRPTNISTGTLTVPANAFLGSTATDGATSTPTPPINATLHGNGSYIAFADGHVQWFDVSYYPPTPARDSSTGQWWNFVSADNPTLNKTIAITPY